MTKADPKPRIESQLKSHQPDPEFPHFGRDALDHSHAIYSIIDHLTTLGLKGWVPQLTKWLAQYDGLEMYAEDEEDPHLCVRQVLANHCSAKNSKDGQPQGEALKARIVEDILELNFIRYRAHWGIDLAPDKHSRKWEPLKMSWFSFLQQGDPEHPTEALHIWITDKFPRPTFDELRAHLLKVES
ncbi:hypothetical protein [Delftia lacustris]|uniref:hypothetical protein n=1 Tax=Delftia lacustris TaxID=558537 RepID=UPI0035A70FC2